MNTSKTMCRICSAPDEWMQDIFKIPEGFYINITFAEMVNFIHSSIQVLFTDDLSNGICSNCSAEVITAYKLKIKMKINELVLKSKRRSLQNQDDLMLDDDVTEELLERDVGHYEEPTENCMSKGQGILRFDNIRNTPRKHIDNTILKRDMPGTSRVQAPKKKVTSILYGLLQGNSEQTLSMGDIIKRSLQNQREVNDSLFINLNILKMETINLAEILETCHSLRRATLLKRNYKSCGETTKSCLSIEQDISSCSDFIHSSIQNQNETTDSVNNNLGVLIKETNNLREFIDTYFSLMKQTLLDRHHENFGETTENCLSTEQKTPIFDDIINTSRSDNDSPTNIEHVGFEENVCGTSSGTSFQATFTKEECSKKITCEDMNMPSTSKVSQTQTKRKRDAWLVQFNNSTF